ncbi:hypothetical protein CHUAL_008825 [Chamberlinius hualienensis]
MSEWIFYDLNMINYWVSYVVVFTAFLGLIISTSGMNSKKRLITYAFTRHLVDGQTFLTVSTTKELLAEMENLNDSGFFSDSETDAHEAVYGSEWNLELQYIDEDQLEEEIFLITALEPLTQRQLNNGQFLREIAKLRILQHRLYYREIIAMGK